MSAEPIDKQIVFLGERRDLQKLQSLIATTSTKTLRELLKTRLERNDCDRFWNYLLLGFDATNYEMREKRFACVKQFLDHLLKVELRYKQAYDLIQILCQELPTFPSAQLVEIYEHCIDGIKLGDPKCVGWKDLLPDTINVLSDMPQVMVNGIGMPGHEYRDMELRNLCTMRWPIEVLTPIANMFRELDLSNKEMEIVLKKLAGTFDSLAPTELPALCFQVFSMCKSGAEIIIPLLALEKYFHRYYYKKLFADMNSNSTDFDSIDKFSDQELREAEETVLHHLNYCTQYKITEFQMCVVLRNFQATPDVILTPFMLSAVITMTSANREPNSVLSVSLLLPFLRTVIKNNEDERKLAEHSVWCRDSLPRKEVDLLQLFTLLVDQNKEGKDIITPGLVMLAFVLLKTKNNSTLNNLAIAFLIRFIRKRFIFGQGIIKELAKWMIIEQQQYQYSECLSQLSVADTFTVSECTKTIRYVMDFFLWIPGEQAMRMMSFILPLLKISATVRDDFIKVLRKAMNSSDMKTRRMAIYGFCMILKQLNNSNAQRSQIGSSASYCTQHSISGFSLMSQATLGSRSNPQRNFDLLTIEIIGVLRICFSQNVDIKTTLYEYIQRAVELNPKLSPHVLQFLDSHFRSYFDVNNIDDEMDDAVETTDIEFAVKFDKIVQAHDLEQNEIIVNDNLGKLLLCVAHCLGIFDEFETDYDTRGIKRLLKLSLDKIVLKELKFEELTGSLTHYKSAVCVQQIHFIESIMAFVLLSSRQTNDNVKSLGPLFKEQQKLLLQMRKAASSVKKNPKKSKNESSVHNNTTINGVSVATVNTRVENIWDFDITEKLLRLLHEDMVPFAASCNTQSLRSNIELVRYVFLVTMEKLEDIYEAPEYKQLMHSKRTLKFLTDITKVIYERCIKRLPELWQNFDSKTAILAAECFQKCLQTANKVYKKSFMTGFVKVFDTQAHQQPNELPTTLHNVIDVYMREMRDEASDTPQNVVEKERIPAALLLCLEVLYEKIVYDDSMTTESYAWLLKFCGEYAIQSRPLTIVHKLLFTQRQKTHSGAFFIYIALQLARVWGRIDDSVEIDEICSTQNPDLKAVNLETAVYCLQYFLTALRKQIDDVNYFISKANNALFKLRIVPENDHDMSLAALRSLQRSICTQLVHIANAIFELTNVCLPLGSTMDGVLKLIMHFYVCLKQLAKHFLGCATRVSLQGSKFDLLLRVVGNPLPRRIYEMINYIDNNVLDKDEIEKANTKKKINAKADKERVMRGTKQIPQLIFVIEDFNKHVIVLSKKGKERLTSYLHMGAVRDFRLKSEQLRAAVSRTLSHSSQIECDSSEQGEISEENEIGDDVAEDEEESLIARFEAESAELDDNITSSGAARDEQSENEDDNIDENDGYESWTSASTSKVSKVARKKESRRQENYIDDEVENSGDVTPTPEEILLENNLNESEPNSSSQLIRNLKKVNKKAAKRALEESEKNTDPDVVALVLEQPKAKKRRGRSAKK